MSAFTTPSRASASSHRGGGSSSRRVVRSALELLMDSATPELPARSGGYTSTNNNNTTGNSSSTNTMSVVANTETLRAARRSPAAASPSSSFSVSYAAAPPSTAPTSHEAVQAPSSTRANQSRPSTGVAAEASPAASATSARTRGGGSDSAEATSRPLTAHSRVAEPSALAFLSPQGKAARGAAASSASGPRRQPSLLSASASAKEDQRRQRHRTRVVFADDGDDDDVEEYKAAGGVGSRTAHRTESPAPTPISPSRSLHSDVEAAQQQRVTDTYTRSTSSNSSDSAAETSFLVEEEDDEDDDFSSINSSGSRVVPSSSPRQKVDAHVDANLTRGATVPAAEVQSLISAALRRYETERDAEEEAVLQQVSAEVEEQAARYTALADAYDSVCADNKELQARLTTSERTCRDVEAALQSARQTQQAQRESMKRMEVELYHAKDAQTQTYTQQRQQLDGEAAEWEAARRRYEKRQATLEAQLTQLREEAEEKDRSISDLTRQLRQQSAEMEALRQHTSQRDAAVDSDYADIHDRMRRLAQNMASMEAALQERDDAITQLRGQLSDAAASAQHGERCAVRLLEVEEEHAKTCAELTRARSAVQRQTDDARKRMHRLTLLEQQKSALTAAVQAACRTLTKSAEEQASVLPALEELTAVVQRLTERPQHRATSRDGTTAASATRMAEARRTRSPGSEGRRENITHDERSRSVVGAPHPDDTLVYDNSDGDKESDEDGTSVRGFPSDSEYSESDEEVSSTPLTAAVAASEDQTEEEEEVMSREVSQREERAVGRVAKEAAHKSMRGKAAPPTPSPPHTNNTTTTSAGSQSAQADTSTPGVVCEREMRSVRRLAHTLHHNVAQVHVLLRGLRRLVATLATQRVPSPARLAAEESSRSGSRRGAAGGASTQRNNHRLITPSTLPSSTLPARPSDLVHKLEQACRYLKSELAAVTEQLSEAQAECQWRTLSMQKWEAEVQAARRDVLALEKERLTSATERETLDLVRQELEEQLAEAQRTCATAQTAHVKAASALESAQQELQEASTGRTTAEAALAQETAKSTRFSAKVSELTAAQVAFTDELATLQDKYKASLTQLQSLRAQEATQQLKEQQERRSHGSELADLRTAVAQLRVAESTWESERGRLQKSLEGARETLQETERTCRAQAAAAALQCELECATLCAIANIVGASMTPPAAAVTCADGEVRTSPTEKRLFDGDEPSVEVLKVMEGEGAEEEGKDAAGVASVVRTSMLQRLLKKNTSLAVSPHPSRTPRQRLLHAVRTPTASTNRKARPSPSSTPSSSTHATDGTNTSAAAAAAASAAYLAQLRQDVVAAVQRVMLELARLRGLRVPPHIDAATPAAAAAVASPMARAAPHVGSAVKAQGRGRVSANNGGDSGGESGWFGGANSEALTASPPSAANTTDVPLLHASRITCPPQRGVSQPHVPAVHTTSLTPQRRHALATSPAHSPATEHVYNVSPWTPSRLQWSPSVTPPHVQVKAWSALRRSSSTEDGLTGASNSTVRGDVDGSGSPARPPSLRVASRTR